jgi:shikimate kinase
MPAELNGVFLMGLRGAGKSTLASPLAAALGFEPLDTDALLQARHGLAAGQLLTERGIADFRRLERELLDELLPVLETGGRVLALGGGMVETPDVLALLERLRQEAGYRGVWLLASPRILARRVARSPIDRPRLAGGSLEAEMRVLSARRASAFRSLADLRIETSSSEPMALAEELARRLRSL